MLFAYFHSASVSGSEPEDKEIRLIAHTYSLLTNEASRGRKGESPI